MDENQGAGRGEQRNGTDADMEIAPPSLVTRRDGTGDALVEIVALDRAGGGGTERFGQLSLDRRHESCSNTRSSVTNARFRWVLTELTETSSVVAI